MLDNLADYLSAHKPTLDLLRQRVLLKVTLITIGNTDVNTACLGSDNLDRLHALFREVNRSRVRGIDLNRRDSSGDLDFEGG